MTAKGENAMRKSRLIVLVLFLLPFSAVSAQGQDPDEWEVSMFVGYSGASSGTFTTPVVGAINPQQVGLSFKESYAVGGRLTQNMGERFGGEVEYRSLRSAARHRLFSCRLVRSLH